MLLTDQTAGTPENNGGSMPRSTRKVEQERTRWFHKTFTRNMDLVDLAETAAAAEEAVLPDTPTLQHRPEDSTTPTRKTRAPVEQEVLEHPELMDASLFITEVITWLFSSR